MPKALVLIKPESIDDSMLTHRQQEIAIESIWPALEDYVAHTNGDDEAILGLLEVLNGDYLEARPQDEYLANLLLYLSPYALSSMRLDQPKYGGYNSYLLTFMQVYQFLLWLINQQLPSAQQVAPVLPSPLNFNWSGSISESVYPPEDDLKTNIDFLNRSFERIDELTVEECLQLLRDSRMLAENLPHPYTKAYVTLLTNAKDPINRELGNRVFKYLSPPSGRVVEYATDLKFKHHIENFRKSIHKRIPGSLAPFEEWIFPSTPRESSRCLDDDSMSRSPNLVS